MNKKVNNSKDDRIGDDVIVCRCEEVTAGQVRAAIRQGANDMDSVKKMTRAGMGLCQNKACYNIIAKIISQETGKELSELKPFTSRPPVRPLKIKLLKEETKG